MLRVSRDGETVEIPQEIANDPEAVEQHLDDTLGSPEPEEDDNPDVPAPGESYSVDAEEDDEPAEGPAPEEEGS